MNKIVYLFHKVPDISIVPETLILKYLILEMLRVASKIKSAQHLATNFTSIRYFGSQFSREKRNILVNFFKSDPCPDAAQYRILEQETAIPLAKIKNWFQVERYKYKQKKIALLTEKGLSDELVAVKLTEIEKPNYKFKRIYSQKELDRIDEIFESDMYPSVEVRDALAKEFGRTRNSIDSKFSKKRVLYSKMYLEPLQGEYRKKFDYSAKLELLEAFDVNDSPSKEQKVDLSKRLGLAENQVSCWFYREKYNRKNLAKKNVPVDLIEDDHAKLSTG